MATVRTRVVWDRKAVRDLRLSHGVQVTQRAVAGQVAAVMRRLAPRDTGAGAASIDVRDAKRAVGALDVGWDAAHWYLIFPEFGTVFQPTRRFARAALYDYDYM